MHEPYGKFQKMEKDGVLTATTEGSLNSLCASLTESAWILANALPTLSDDVMNALTLLTLGAQFRGSYNNVIGRKANKKLFATIRSIVGKSILEDDAKCLVIQNAAGRKVRIEFAPDPDIAIREQLSSGRLNNRIAIEIKGGKDVSNIHNRIGEAEKSHQKSKHQGFTQFWTMVNVEPLDPNVAGSESPTTTKFFTIDRVVDEESSEHQEFRELLASELGLPS